jgi:predicted transcriptional regulator
VRVAKHIVNLQQLDAGDKNPHIQELRRQLELNRVGHNELVTFCNTNFETFSTVTQHLDARLGALFIAFNDFIRGGLANVTREGALIAIEPIKEEDLGPGVDWEAYIKYHLRLAQEALVKYEAQKKQQEALITPEGANAPEESQTNDVVFGGDQEYVEISAGDQAGAKG